MEKRQNKTKEQIEADILSLQRVNHMKEIVRKIFPLLEVPTIYDGQTVLNAFSGFAKADLQEKLEAIKIGDLNIDLSKQEENPIKNAMIAIADLFADEPAETFIKTIERLSQAFSEYGATKFVKNPMTDMKLQDILAE